MISGTLMLFNWSLKMDSRSIYPHIIRAVFSFLMLFFISMAWVDVFGTSRTGLRYFESICFLNVLIITVCGVSYFVTAVTEEKDAGTFALLRLAGLTALSITLGKSTSRLVSSLMLLVIQLPFTFLAITLGGVLWQQIIASYIALAAWMVLVANLALFASVRCATSGRAAGMAGVILVLFFVLPGVITNGLAAFPAGYMPAMATNALASIPPALESINILSRLSILLQTDQEIVFLGQQFWISMTVALALFVVSTLTLDVWSIPTEVGGPSENPAIRRWSVGRSWPMAVMWKEFLFFTGGRSFFVAKLIGGGVVFAGFFMVQGSNGYNGGFTLTGEYGWFAFQTFAGFLALEVLLYSSGCLFYEIRQSTQSTLASIPLSGVRILLEKAGGCLIALIPAVFWLGVTTICGYESIAHWCSMTRVISFMIVLGFASHIAVILSLYTRWAALPLTILISAPAFFCLAGPILGLTAATNALARSQHIESTLLLSAFVNLFWTWLFVLLPLQLWIRDRWNDISQF
ncbi:MAG: hypothetical protein O2856_04970 [Planctomycetota bacterium]|nr:hypothetical protein [Planctomycetota bacterium]